MNGDSAVYLIIFITLGVLVVAALIAREATLQYWKINERLQVLKSIDSKLSYLIPNENSLNNNSVDEKIESEPNYANYKIDTTNIPKYENTKWKYFDDNDIPSIIYVGSVEDNVYRKYHQVIIRITSKEGEANVIASVSEKAPNGTDHEVRMTNDSYISVKSKGESIKLKTISISGSVIVADADELVSLLVNSNEVELSVVKKGLDDNEYFTIKVDCRGFDHEYNKLF